MNSLIITSKNEPETIGRAIKAVLTQIDFKDWEIIITAPDKPTLNAAKKTLALYQIPDTRYQLLKDSGLGKPHALNLAISQARTEILVLTDGDVFLDKNALKNLLSVFPSHQQEPNNTDVFGEKHNFCVVFSAARPNPLWSLQRFFRANRKHATNSCLSQKQRPIGLVSGHPVSINNPQTMLGFWSHLLTQSAHRLRLQKSKANQYFDASGYLLAVKRSLLKKIPKETLAEDAFISKTIWQKGYKIAYAPHAKVYVKFPTTYADWLKQKIRSTGSTTEKFNNRQPQMRSFFQEIKDISTLLSSFKSITYQQLSFTNSLPVKLKYFLFFIFYFSFLFLARLHLWLLIFWKIKIQKLPLSKVWQPAKTTKS